MTDETQSFAEFFARLRESRPSEEVNLHAHMLQRDPHDHTRLRRLAQKAFAPRHVEQLRPR